MTRHNNFLHHRSNPHASYKDDRVAYMHALVTFCFFCVKRQSTKDQIDIVNKPLLNDDFVPAKKI